MGLYLFMCSLSVARQTLSLVRTSIHNEKKEIDETTGRYTSIQEN